MMIFDFLQQQKRKKNEKKTANLLKKKMKYIDSEYQMQTRNRIKH